MDALMAALVAAMAIQATDRSGWRIAMLAAHLRQHGQLIAGAVIALAIVNALSAAGGATIAPRLTPNARALFLAIALGAAGIGCFGRLKPPESLERWRIGALLSALIGTLVLGFGSAQFLVVAITLRSDQPVFAAIGATLGGAVVAVAATALPEPATRRSRSAAVRVPLGIMLLIAGAIAALSALRLI